MCIAGNAVQGSSCYGLKDIPYQSYQLCANDGLLWGDGITPVSCALGLEGAEHVLLDQVYHAPSAEKKGNMWYGSREVVDLWEKYLQQRNEVPNENIDLVV